MTGRRGDWRLVTLLAIFLLVPAISRVLMDRVPTLHKLELLVYDWHCSSLPPLPPDPRLVYIGMDDASLVPLLPAVRRYYPLPRTMHAHLVDVLRGAGAKVIGFDVMFTRNSPGDDQVFAAALKSQAVQNCRTILAIDHKSIPVNGREEFYFDAGLPTPALLPYARPVSICASRQLDRVRDFPVYPVDASSGNRYLQMPVALAASFFGEADREPLLRSEFRLGRLKIPLGNDNQALIRYAGPDGTFAPVPYAEVYGGAWRKTRGPHFFQGKIVLVGRYNAHEDRQDTPWGEMAGTEILLNETQTVLQGWHLEHWTEANTYLLKLFLCTVLVLVVLRTGLRWAFLTVVLEALTWASASHELFLHQGIWMDTVEPLGALAATYILAVAFETQRMRLVFHRFLPREIAEEMLRANLNHGTKTEERQATVVFCDVRDYTHLSETLPLEVMEEMLHRYFIAGEMAAHHQGSEIDKFVGDEIMLFFQDKETSSRRRGAAPEATHAVRAVRWALEMQEEAAKIGASGLAGKQGFKVGIGICSGLVRIGTVGALQRIQHTVIGDAANTASRLQGASKELGRGIVMAGSTWEQVQATIPSELLGEIRVKGKEEPLQTYCPVAARRGD